jgi:hypothetical protein
MGISSLKGTGSARRSFKSTATTTGAGNVLTISGSGKLIAMAVSYPIGVRTLTVTIDGTTYYTETFNLNSSMTCYYTNLMKANQNGSADANISECNISFSQNLVISSTGGITIEFLYETEV